jgi:hypothetical protein
VYSKIKKKEKYMQGNRKSLLFLLVMLHSLCLYAAQPTSQAEIQKKKAERSIRLKNSVDKISALVTSINKNSLLASKAFKDSKLIAHRSIIPSIMYLHDAGISIDPKYKLFKQVSLLNPYFEMMDNFESIKKILADEILKETFNISSFAK